MTDALGLCIQTLPSNHWGIADCRSLLGEAIANNGRFEEAEPLLVDGYTVLKEIKGPSNPHCRDALNRLVSLFDEWGKPDIAAEYRVRLSALQDSQQ